MSSLESQILEGKAALAACEADRAGILSELAVAREVSGRVEELRAAIAEAMSREETLKVEVAATKNAIEVIHE